MPIQTSPPPVPPWLPSWTSGSKWTIFSGRRSVTYGLALLTIQKHSRLLCLHIIKEFLNDQLTSQQKAMILRADTERISETLFDHPKILS